MTKRSLVLFFAFFWTVTPYALGETSRCEIGSPGPARIDGTWVETGSLFVSVSWSEGPLPDSPVKLEVLDRKRVVVAYQEIEPSPGKTSFHQLTEDPDFFQIHGYWFTIRLADNLGEVVAPPVPILISLCSEEESCLYSVVEGVGSDTVAMGSELFDLLEEQSALGVGDLLNAALIQRPDLKHQIYWVGDQFHHLQASNPEAECTCLWQTEFERTPEYSTSFPERGNTPVGELHPDWETLVVEGAGAIVGMGSQILGGPPRTLLGSGEARLGLHLRCIRISDWIPTNWSGLPLNLPVFQPCEASCPDAHVGGTASAQSKATAIALTAPAHGARSGASSSTAFFLNEQTTPAFTTLATVEVNRLGGDTTATFVVDYPPLEFRLWSTPGRDGTAAFTTQGQLDVCLSAFGSAGRCAGSFPRSLSTGRPWAFGCTASATEATLEGNASCTQWSGKTSTLGSPRLYSQGGLVILPWRP